MQEMTSTICNATTTPYTSATSLTYDHTTNRNYVPRTTLKDTRDGKTYKVSKLADGNCWMSENLRIGNQNSQMTLTTANSDVSSNFTLPAGRTTWWNASGQIINSFLLGSTSIANWKTSYGNYYTWYTATAGGYSDSYSICPKNWTLARYEGNKSFENLVFDVYGFSSSDSSNSKLIEDPLSIEKSGNASSSDTGGVGNIGAVASLWSSREGSSDSGTYFTISNTRGVYKGSDGFKDVGRTVRCVAR